MSQCVLCFALSILLPSAVMVQQQSQTEATSSTSVANANAQDVAADTRPAVAHTLLDGTPIKLRMSETISSADAKVGQEIPFEVLEDVDVDGLPVIKKGATAIGTVTEAQSKRSMGRAGKLNMSISYVRLTDSEKAALRAVKDAKGGGHVGAMTGAMVATSIVFFPAAPLFLFVHGKDITIPQGTEITAFVQGDMHLDMSRFGAAPAAVTQAAAIGTPFSSCSLVVSSTPAGADIEIDGSFVGNTPSTVTVAAGKHKISVKKKGFSDWSRDLNITGGSITLNATLDPASGQ